MKHEQKLNVNICEKNANATYFIRITSVDRESLPFPPIATISTKKARNQGMMNEKRRHLQNLMLEVDKTQTLHLISSFYVS